MESRHLFTFPSSSPRHLRCTLRPGDSDSSFCRTSPTPLPVPHSRPVAHSFSGFAIPCPRTDPKRHGAAESGDPPDRALSLEMLPRLRGLRGLQALPPDVLHAAMAPPQGGSERLGQAHRFATGTGSRGDISACLPPGTSPRSGTEMRQLLAGTRQDNRSHSFPVPLGQDLRPILAIISS